MTTNEWLSCAAALVTVGLTGGCGGNTGEGVGTEGSASTETLQEQICFNVQTGESCDCNPSCDPDRDNPAGGPGCPIQCHCDPVYGQQCVTENVTVEVPTTPVGVNRYSNATTGQHYYTTGSGAPAGYTFEEHAYSLANDTGYGAVPFSYLSSGQGFFFNDQSAIPELVPVYFYYNPRRGDAFTTTNPDDVANFPCTGAVCDFNPATGSCDPLLLPDCYSLILSPAGYVGQ